MLADVFLEIFRTIFRLSLAGKKFRTLMFLENFNLWSLHDCEHRLHNKLVKLGAVMEHGCYVYGSCKCKHLPNSGDSFSHFILKDLIIKLIIEDWNSDLHQLIRAVK